MQQRDSVRGRTLNRVTLGLRLLSSSPGCPVLLGGRGGGGALEFRDGEVSGPELGLFGGAFGRRVATLHAFS